MTFRKLIASDVPQVKAILHNKRISPSCSIPHPFSIADAERFARGKHYGLFQSVHEKDYLRCIVSFCDGELGYAVQESHWGFGIGGEAVDAFFNAVKPEEVRAEVLSTNVASLRILLKRGFEIVGWREHCNENWPKKVPVLKLYWRRDYE